MRVKFWVTLFLCFNLLCVLPARAQEAQGNRTPALSAIFPQTPPVSAPQCQETKTLQGVRTIVFISLGMPEGSLRKLFVEGVDRRDTLFVLRGWNPPYLLRLFRAVHKLLPKGHAVNVVIDPILFRGYGIQDVPVILSKSPKNGRWYRVTGEISITGAQNLIAQGKGGRTAPPVGPLYPIKEPDILAIAQKRIKNYNWHEVLQQAKSSISYRTGPQIVLPSAHRSRSFWVDPSIKTTKALKLPDGTVVIPKGTTLNPLDYVSLGKSYIFFDPGDSRQIKVVKRWLNDDPTKTVLVSTHAVPNMPSIEGRRILLANRFLIDRFHITALPAMVEQAGHRLNVRIEKCDGP